jgi:thioredoxin reductase (NADPH)
MAQISKDVLIVGAGPAGMSAAIYLARSRYTFSIVEKGMVGGKLNISTKIENYLGVGMTSGFKLAQEMLQQVKDFGIEIAQEEILDVKKEGDLFHLIGSQNEYLVKVLLIATGSSNKKSQAVGEDKFIGKGISYCAICDGFFYKNSEVAVFANERKGYLEALYLSNIVSKLYLINDKDEDDAEGNLKKLKEKDNVEFFYPYKISEFFGENELDGVKIKSLDGEEGKTLVVHGCFPFLGDSPSNYLASKLALDMNRGYIVVDKNMATSKEGVYAIGDIVDKPLRQIATAVSDGAIAATSIVRLLNSRR